MPHSQKRLALKTARPHAQPTGRRRNETGGAIFTHQVVQGLYLALQACPVGGEKVLNHFDQGAEAPVAVGLNLVQHIRHDGTDVAAFKLHLRCGEARRQGLGVYTAAALAPLAAKLRASLDCCPILRKRHSNAVAQFCVFKGTRNDLLTPVYGERKTAKKGRSKSFMPGRPRSATHVAFTRGCGHFPDKPGLAYMLPKYDG